MKLLVKIIISVVICLGLGILSGFSTIDEITGWYSTLNKPSFNPPNWLFGPAWSLLYTLMGISVALVWHKLSQQGKKLFSILGTKLFVVQFILNLAWSTIFFSFHQTGLALIEIVILWIFILMTIIHFYKFKKVAGLLLIPYILWVSFATLLTASIYYLN